MRFTPLLILLGFLSTTALAACGSNTGTHSRAIPTLATKPTAKIAFTLKIPPKTASRIRRALYISPSTTQVDLFTTENGVVTDQGITPCVNLVCTGSFSVTIVPGGALVGAFLEDANGNLLATGSTSITLVEGINDVTITCFGFVQSGSFTAAQPLSFTVGAASTIPTPFVVQDTDGNTITGNFIGLFAGMSLALTNTGGGALSAADATHFTFNQANPSNTTQAAATTLAYDGGPLTTTGVTVTLNDATTLVASLPVAINAAQNASTITVTVVNNSGFINNFLYVTYSGFTGIQTIPIVNGVAVITNPEPFATITTYIQGHYQNCYQYNFQSYCNTIYYGIGSTPSMPFPAPAAVTLTYP